MKKYYILIVLVFLSVSLDRPADAVISIELTKESKSIFSVVMGENASVRVKKAAADLAVFMAKISGADFAIRKGDGTEGIAVGLVSDFPSLPLTKELTINNPADQEAYILKSHKRGLYVIGATELAVEHAVWDLLYRLGYRQFFPGETWEVIPHQENLKIAIEVIEKPDYFTRRIWYGFGLWDYNKKPYEQWCRRNRTASGFVLDTSHAYESLIRQNQAVFQEHPEFMGLLEGQRKSSKLCIGNPDLRELVADHAVRYFQNNPRADSISMDPSDGGGWCECNRCAALGSVSDRAIFLTNKVAEVVNKIFKNKYVGMYAYNYHSPPPNIRVHPNVIISIATSFIKGGYSLEELIDGWSRQGATLGIREYYSVHPWDQDLPGKSKGSNLEYLQQTIPHFYHRGARFMSAESSDNWALNGLGYYIASRILWDIKEAQRIDELVDDFLTKAFGPAQEPMRRFYQLINGANHPLLSDDLLGRMYRYLAEAQTRALTPQIQARIRDLILYTRYVELFQKYAYSQGRQRQSAFAETIRHGYRMRKTMMIHTKALYRDRARRDKKVTLPENAAWSVPEERNPWKSSEPFSQTEVDSCLAQGVTRYKLRGFEPYTFSKKLAPAQILNLPEVQTHMESITGRNTQTFYTWVEKPPSVIHLKVTGGLITHYRNRGDVKIDLWKIQEGEKSKREKKVAHGETPPDGVERAIMLKAVEVGLHKITINDGGDMTRVSWKPSTPLTVISSLENLAKLSGRWSLYFYVPKETKYVGMYAEGTGSLMNESGEIVFQFENRKPNFYKIEVPDGQDGTCWKFHQNTGTRILMTVPPCLARNTKELLLPEEIVRLDSLK
jgi:uncharacterized protein DUF4838